MRQLLYHWRFANDVYYADYFSRLSGKGYYEQLTYDFSKPIGPEQDNPFLSLRRLMERQAKSKEQDLKVMLRQITGIGNKLVNLPWWLQINSSSLIIWDQPRRFTHAHDRRN